MDISMKDILLAHLRQYVRVSQNHANVSRDFVKKAEEWSRKATRIDKEHGAAMTSIQQCVTECSRLNEDLDQSRTRILGMIELADINFRTDPEDKMLIMEAFMNALEEISRLSCAVNQHIMVITRIYKDGIVRIRMN